MECFPCRKTIASSNKSSHIAKKSILNNIHVHVSSLNFKPAYYTSLKSDKWIYTAIHHSTHLFSKVFLAYISAANPRTVIRQEPILERYSTLSATTKPTVKKIFDAGRNGTARIASPMVRILKKRRLSLLSNTTCNELQLQCSRCTCVIKHRKLMLAWLCLSKVGMIMFVEFTHWQFCPITVGEDCMMSQKNICLGGVLIIISNNYYWKKVRTTGPKYC